MKIAFSLQVHYYQHLRLVRKMILKLFHSLFLKVMARNFFFLNRIFILLLYHLKLSVHFMVPFKLVLIWLYFLFNYGEKFFMARIVFGLMYLFMGNCLVLANHFFKLLVGILFRFFAMFFNPDFIFMFASVF